MSLVKLFHIRDPVHNYISMPEEGILADLIDTLEFQRLRYIRQMGVAYQVYPGAEHSRFFHSIGVCHLAGRMYDFLTGDQADPDERNKLLVAALLHDIGHSPFSHALEGFFTPKFSHEDWTSLIIQEGTTQTNEILSSSSYKPEEIASLLSEYPSKPQYLHLILSSQLDADRFDYLQRDGQYSGVPYGNLDLERILRTIKLSPEERIWVVEKGKHSVGGYIISRYHMYNQVYYHKTILCFEFLLQSILRRAIDLYQNNSDGDVKLPMFGDVPMSTDMKILPSDFLRITDSDLLHRVREWMRSSDSVLSDLSSRFLGRRKIFKPVKKPRITKQTLYDRKEKIEKVLETHQLDPKYYCHVSMDETKPAYRPYAPQKEDQENAILCEGDIEICELLPALRQLGIESSELVCVPEELRDEVSEMLK